MLNEFQGLIDGGDGIDSLIVLSAPSGILGVTGSFFLSESGFVLLKILDGLANIDFSISESSGVILKESLVGGNLGTVVSDGLLKVVLDLVG